MMIREAAADDLPGLLERLATYLPNSFTVHGVVKIRLRYNLDTGKRVLVAPAPSSLVLITPMSAEADTQSLTLFWDTDREDDGTVAELLASSPHLDWTKPQSFCNVAIPVLQKVEQMMRSGQLGNGRLVAQPITYAHLYTVTASRLPTTPRLPRGFRLGAIKEHHVEHLYKHWEYNIRETLGSYKFTLRTLPAVGAYITTSAPATTTEHETLQDNSIRTISGSKTPEDYPEGTGGGKKTLGNTLEGTFPDDNASGETLNTIGDEDGRSDTSMLPVAWSTLYHNNIISNTFTLKEYRRRGLGRAVTAALAARVLQDDNRVSAFLVYNNDASIKLHEQLGFTRECALGNQSYDILKDVEI